MSVSQGILRKTPGQLGLSLTDGVCLTEYSSSIADKEAISHVLTMYSLLPCIIYSKLILNFEMKKKNS